MPSDSSSKHHVPFIRLWRYQAEDKLVLVAALLVTAVNGAVMPVRSVIVAVCVTAVVHTGRSVACQLQLVTYRGVLLCFCLRRDCRHFRS